MTTTTTTKTAREHAKDLEADGAQCKCDLDRWQPEPLTGHSWVCPIHKIAIERRRGCKL